MIEIEIEPYRETQTIYYSAFARGFDSDNNPCIVELNYWPNNSGCNPYRWQKVILDHNGKYRFSRSFIYNYAEPDVEHVALSYNVRSVDISTVEFRYIEVTTSIRTREIHV